MSNFEIYENLHKTGGIWGYMYGERTFSIPIEEDVIFINTKNLTIGKNADCFIFIWGYPGPDGNIYEFKDYGKTWSFNREDLY